MKGYVTLNIPIEKFKGISNQSVDYTNISRAGGPLERSECKAVRRTCVYRPVTTTSKIKYKKLLEKYVVLLHKYNVTLYEITLVPKAGQINNLKFFSKSLGKSHRVLTREVSSGGVEHYHGLLIVYHSSRSEIIAAAKSCGYTVWLTKAHNCEKYDVVNRRTGKKFQRKVKDWINYCLKDPQKNLGKKTHKKY